jgi:cyclopropane-fatty-acyl-phospholipid synthase
MLDKRIVYSCGYWKGAKNVDEAQEAKLDLICRKLGLKPGEKVLDIGCGWGSFAKYAAEKCGADVVEITSLRNNRPWLGNFARDCPSR